MSETALKAPKPFVNPYVAGAVLGVVLFLAFLLTGNGLGASGPINRVLVYIEDIFVPQHVNTTPYLIPMAGGGTNPLDNAFVFLSIGILIGGFTSGFFNHRLSFTTGKGPGISSRTRWGMAFLGGILMGYGARFARGCTSGQGLSGGAVLSVGSWVFLLAVFVGAYSVAHVLRKLWT